MDKFFDSRKIIYSGNPVRESIKIFKSLKNDKIYNKLNLLRNKNNTSIGRKSRS